MSKESDPDSPQQGPLVVVVESINRVYVGNISRKSHPLWREVLHSLPFVILLTLLVQFFEFSGWLGSAEGRLFDNFVTLDPFVRDTTARMVTLEIDDPTYQDKDCFGD